MKKLSYEKNLDDQSVPVDQNGKHGIFIGKMVVGLK
jgi:5'-nucleotidase